MVLFFAKGSITRVLLAVELRRPPVTNLGIEVWNPTRVGAP